MNTNVRERRGTFSERMQALSRLKLSPNFINTKLLGIVKEKGLTPAERKIAYGLIFPFESPEKAEALKFIQEKDGNVSGA